MLRPIKLQLQAVSGGTGELKNLLPVYDLLQDHLMQWLHHPVGLITRLEVEWLEAFIDEVKQVSVSCRAIYFQLMCRLRPKHKVHSIDTKCQ